MFRHLVLALLIGLLGATASSAQEASPAIFSEPQGKAAARVGANAIVIGATDGTVYAVEPRQQLVIQSVVPTAIPTLDIGESVIYTITVVDPENRPVPGARVEIDDGLLSAVITVGETDGAGQITYQAVVPEDAPNGLYILTFVAQRDDFDDSDPVRRQVEVQPPIKQDSLALVAFYNATDGPNWHTNTNWLDGPVSSWFGVTVDGDRVVVVTLQQNGLNGQFPDSLDQLENLEVLDLFQNELTGEIPAVLGNLGNLRRLDLRFNQLSGEIPDTLGNLVNLDFLALNDNQLTGKIPVTLSDLSNLRILFLDDNQLTGEIPPELGNLTNLTNLSLHDNQLTGKIPAELGAFPNLRDELLLSGNQLIGNIPEELGNHTEVFRLWLSDNQLTGRVPNSFANLSRVAELYLNNNKLDSLPDLSSLTSIVRLRVQNNEFTFEDIEPNIGVASGSFTYSPQANVGMAGIDSLNVGESLTLDITVGGDNNVYQWLRDGVAIPDSIPGATTDTFTISEATSADAGSYVLQITNTLATELTLESEPIAVRVNLAPLVVNPENPILDQTLAADTFSVNLNTVFIDPSDEGLTYSASSSDTTVARVEVTGDTLEVAPVPSAVGGEATITVTATNTTGGQASVAFQITIDQAPEVALGLQEDATFNEDYLIQAVITDNGRITSAEVNFRRGGDADFIPFLMRPTAGDTTLYELKLPGFAITDRGIEYFVTATDEAGEAGLVTREPSLGVISVSVFVPDDGIDREEPQPANTYRLFSVPLDLENKDPNDVLADDLGAYDDTRWRFFELVDGAGVGDYDEFPNTSDMVPGKAFWLIVSDPAETIETGPGSTIRTDEPFSIPLNPGWNFIGNPFNFPIPISKVFIDSDQPLTIFTFDGSEYVFSVETLEPFEGYGVFNDSTGTSTLLIDPEIFPNSTASVPRMAAKTGGVAGQENALWSIRIRAQSGATRDVETVAAVASNASANWDRLDHPEPPHVPGDHVSVYFSHPEWQRITARYSIDARPEPAAGAVWPVEVTTTTRDKVHLTFEDLDDVPPEFEVWLVDDILQISQNLRETNTYTVAGSEQPRSLKLVVGKRGFMERELQASREVPTRFELFQNFPNPFNPSTTVRYGLPAAERVSLVIYNVLGEKVATLAAGTQQSAGYHAVIWDGRGDAGTLVASGVYFVRMRAGRFVQTQTMVLVK